MTRSFRMPQEPIKLLWWFSSNGKKHTNLRDMNLTVGEKLDYCGPCTITANRSLLDIADAIIIGNGPLLKFQKEILINESNAKLGKMPKKEVFSELHPDFHTRNSSQFWVFQNKESAIKNIENQPWMMDPKLDAAFNLTISYRRDSDIVRKYGMTENILRISRFNFFTGKFLKNDTDYLADLIGKVSIRK